ncbi:MAG: BACON domain-containing protein [Bacteroidales bacterium]
MKFVNTLFRNIAFSAAISSLLFAAYSCKEEVGVKEEFSISESAVQFGADGGHAGIKISASEAWTVESNVEWCLVSPGNGLGSTEVELRVDTSYLYKERDGILTFHSGSQARQINVKQFGFEKVIRVEEPEYVVPDYERSDKAFIDVVVTANVEFNIDMPGDVSWVDITKKDAYVSSVPRPRTLRVKYGINTNFDERIANIKLVPALDKDKEAVPGELNIRQEAAPKIIPSREGDSLAVLAICRTLRTYDPSLSGKNMLNWDVVRLAEFPVENGDAGQTEFRVTGLNLFIIDTEESLPYQVKFLSKLEFLSVRSNTNSYLKSIELTPEVCELENLKFLNLFAYGISKLPKEMANMKSLEEINLSSNHLPEIPMDILRNLPNLKAFSLSGCRRQDVNDLSYGEIPGLTGELPAELFTLDNLEYLELATNYFVGSIPDVPVGSMPNLKRLTLNYNFLSGTIPEWILKHPYLGCWNPFTFIFNQEGIKDSNGDRPGFTNVPNRVPDCPLND